MSQRNVCDVKSLFLAFAPGCKELVCQQQYDEGDTYHAHLFLHEGVEIGGADAVDHVACDGGPKTVGQMGAVLGQPLIVAP